MSKLGCIKGVHRSKEYPVAASQKFNRTGGAFVFLDSSGHVTLALTATATIFGYAVVPQGIGSGLGTDLAVWQSSATAGADRIPVIRVTSDAEFLVPSDAATTQAMAGNACDLVGVNDGTQQVIDVGTSTTDVVLIQGPGTDAGAPTTSFAIVKINPAKIQADT